MYAASIADPEAFWAEHGKRIDWIKPFTKVKNTSFEFGNVDIKWFEDGTLNVSANCVDRHLATRGDQTAIIWEPDDPNDAASTSPTRAARLGLQDGQHPGRPRRAQGRPRGHLPADDPRSGLRHAGLRAHRRDPLDRLRRLLARRAGGAHQRLRRQGGHHRRLRPARRPQDRAQVQHRPGAAGLQGHGEAAWWSAHRRADHLDRRPRLRLQRDGAGGRRGQPARWR
jgi:hypothetical protein